MDKDEERTSTDIFWWANNTDGIKDQLDIELFLFTKNYTVYSTQYSKELQQQLKVLFMYDLLNEVQTGAAMGLTVRDFEAAEGEENVLQRTYVDNVQHAQEVLEQIIHGKETLEIFSEGDHEFKRVKGVIAKFSHASMQPFYVVKLLPQTQVLKGATAWMFNEGSFQPFSADAGLRITPDNQVLIIGDEIFAFSESKFERLFGYDAKKHAIADEKIKLIEANFKLSFSEGMSLDSLVKEKKTVINKLQKLDPTLIKQQPLLDHAEEMGIELMEDEAGAIIIMDGADLIKFVNLLNDDYVESNLTGFKYEMKGKKRIDAPDEPKPLPVGV
ncbi:DUF4868 domain-containing protein [Pedobacter sp.]|nr:DUF4868 domain-containing protein [Candidatus Saccharibacteria bacterium]